MAKTKKAASKPLVEQYEHTDADRANIPQVGLVTPATDPDTGSKKIYQYDPHLDPQLQWAGKAEHTSFEVPTQSLHVHERIDPKRIIEAVSKEPEGGDQLSMFESNRKPLREAVEFYRHREGWSNRMIAGDSLIVMNSLLEKEGMGGKVQMVYFDPPYGIKYGSNFQPFVNKRDVKDGKDEDLTSEPEMIKAFRDTWELGIHSYLTYLRDRLLLARDLLSESGSVFVQISDENIHHIREILDEVFGHENFISMIAYTTTSGFTSSKLSRAGDYLVWYGKDVTKTKYHQLFTFKKDPLDDPKTKYDQVELSDGTRRPLSYDEKLKLTPLPEDSRIFRYGGIDSQGSSGSQPFEFNGKTYYPSNGRHWTANYPEGMNRLVQKKRVAILGSNLSYVRYFDDFPLQPIHNLWSDVGGSVQSRSDPKVYVVQTGTSVVQRCMLMSTDPGDLVLDITCGSGTTAFVAEQWGRRWITCDTSRVALNLAKQRLMTSVFDYYELARPKEGISSGFKYKNVPHITLKSIANNESPVEETLYDQPVVDARRVRVTGPFTVEAVPAPTVRSFDEVETNMVEELDGSVTRTGETLRQDEWRTELLRTGIRGKGGDRIEFTRVEPLQGTRYLQAEAETKDDNPRRVLVCFGPEHAPLEQRLVELALEEAESIRPRPNIVLFCAFQFDAEAAKDIDETNWPGVTLLRAEMNKDLLTEDLKKARSTNDSFWLIGQPEVISHEVGGGKIEVEVLGFDYFDSKTGQLRSGGRGDIAMWMLDTNYDGRSVFPSQVFLPLSDSKGGWNKLKKDLKAVVDKDLIEAFNTTRSLPFVPGKVVAVKIVDSRGIESLKIIRR